MEAPSVFCFFFIKIVLLPCIHFLYHKMKSFPQREPIKIQKNDLFKLNGLRTTCALVYTGLKVLLLAFSNRQRRFTLENLFPYTDVELWRVVFHVSHQIAGFSTLCHCRNILSEISHYRSMCWDNVDSNSSDGSIILIEKCQGENKSRPKPMWGLYRLIWYPASTWPQTQLTSQWHHVHVKAAAITEELSENTTIFLTIYIM